MTPEILRPNKSVFIWRPILRLAITATVLTTAGFFFFPLFTGVDPGLLVWAGAALALLCLMSVHRFIAYGKTFYEFYPDRLVVKTGTLAKSSTIDLPYRNVTQVVLRLPWLEHRFFATGHLQIHAAGSAQGMAHLQSIDRPHKIYEAIADHLRHSGFSLQRDQLLQRETPHLIGTVLDTSGLAISGLIGLIFVGTSIGGTIIDALELTNYYELFDVLRGDLVPDDADAEQAALAARSTLGLALLAILGGTLGLTKLAIHFVDLNRRTYTLWDDVVDYEDGFLTETYKFIPIENLADTATTEPFLKRLFGMANVVLRPHGAAAGISFPSMPRAAQFRDHLDGLIERAELAEMAEMAEIDPVAEEEATPPGVDTRAQKNAAHLRPPPTGPARRLPTVEEPPLDLSPSWTRRLLTALLDGIKFPAMLALIALAIYAAVTWTDIDLDQFGLTDEELFFLDWSLYAGLALAALYLLWQLSKAIFFVITTNYAVGRRKITWERDFISRREFEFTIDKITVLDVERDLIDRLTGCATLSFWSIGNSQPIIFEDIPQARQQIPAIRRRLGLGGDEPPPQQRICPSLAPLDIVLRRLYSNLFWLLLAAITVALTPLWAPALYLGLAIALLPLFFALQQAIYHRFSRLLLFDDHLWMRQGILLITDQYVAYDQLRSQQSTRYPLRQAGTLSLITGSHRRLTLPLLPDISALHEALDDRLYDHPMRAVRQPAKLDRTPLSTRRPLSRNALVRSTIFSLSLTLLTILPTVLIFLWYRRTSIAVEAGRVRRVQGLLYRTTQTVLINRIDQLLITRGLFHTLFNNGTVSLLTVGSSLPSLRLGPIDDYQPLYDQIEARTKDQPADRALQTAPTDPPNHTPRPDRD